MISEYYKKIIDKKRSQIKNGIIMYFMSKSSSDDKFDSVRKFRFTPTTALEYMLEMLKGMSFTCHDTRGPFYDIGKDNQISLDEFKKRVEKLSPKNYKLVLSTSKSGKPYHPYIAIDNGPKH